MYIIAKFRPNLPGLVQWWGIHDCWLERDPDNGAQTAARDFMEGKCGGMDDVLCMK